jgi:hypothetical protein
MAVANAKAAVRDGELNRALEWLQLLKPEQRPKPLEAEIHYSLAKEAAREGSWGQVEVHLQQAVEAKPSALFEKRLALVRHRHSGIADHSWQSMRASIDAARRLPSDILQPELVGVWACGAYHSRGHGRSLPWSRMLPLAKSPPVDDEEERMAIVNLATGYFCRYLATETPLLSGVDVVVSIPANADRFSLRMMSLPDELARAAENCLGLPFLPQVLTSEKTDLELRGLSWHERREAIRGAMRVGPLGIAAKRSVLVVDDVLTSGATLRESARILVKAGVGEVYGAVLSHTEG